jgi:hypothetical protein
VNKQETDQCYELRKEFGHAKKSCKLVAVHVTAQGGVATVKRMLVLQRLNNAALAIWLTHVHASVPSLYRTQSEYGP